MKIGIQYSGYYWCMLKDEWEIYWYTGFYFHRNRYDNKLINIVDFNKIHPEEIQKPNL